MPFGNPFFETAHSTNAAGFPVAAIPSAGHIDWSDQPTEHSGWLLLTGYSL